MGLFDTIGSIFGGQTSARIPGPSPEERELSALQVEQLKRQNALTNALLPDVLRQSGYEPTLDAAGNITGVTQTEEGKRRRGLENQLLDLQLGAIEGLDPKAHAEVNKLLMDRQLAALKGELPIDEGLKQSLNEEQGVLQETLRKNLGSGWATSSPAIEAMGKFGLRKQSLFDAARRGDMTLSQQMLGNSLGQTTGLTNVSEALRGTRLGELFSANQMFTPGISNVNPFLSRSMDFRLGAGKLDLSSQQFNSQLNSSTLFGLFGAGPFGRR